MRVPGLKCELTAAELGFIRGGNELLFYSELTDCFYYFF